MKTYRVSAEAANSLRWWLLGAILAVVGCGLAGVVGALLGGPRIGFGMPEGLVLAMIPSAVHGVVLARAVWNLWEWAGLALWGVVVVVSAIAFGISPFLGFIVGVAFFLYVYTQLGHQTGQAAAPDREVFEP